MVAKSKKRKDNATVCFAFYVFAVALTLILFVVTYFTEKSDSVPLAFSDCWYLDEAMTVKADLSHPEFDHLQCSFYARLPEEINMGDCLWFKYKNAYYTVSVNGQIRQENISTWSATTLYGKTPGTDWLCIPLEPDDAAQTIQISFISCYDDTSAFIDELYIGKTPNTLRHAVADRLFGTILCILMMSAGIIMILVYIVLASLVKELPKELLYLGSFAFITSLWSLTELKVMQIFTSKDAGIFHNLECMSLMLIAMPLVLYFKEDLDKKSRLITPLMALATVFNFTVCCVLHFTGIYDFHETLILTHITIGVGAVLVVYANFLRYFKNKDQKKMDILPAVCMFLFIVAAIIDILRYRNGGFNDVSFFTRIALCMYIIMFGVKSLTYIVEMVKKGMKADIIARLAYEDGLTGLGNRTAYNEKLEELKQNTLTIFMFDINNLKYVNDTFGHPSGDELIRTGAEIIASVFGGIGECYRTGGDEFVCLAEGEVDAKQYAEQFYKKINELNQTNKLDFPLMIAIGYEAFDGVSDIEMSVKAADMKMYEKKQELKKMEQGKYIRL